VTSITGNERVNDDREILIAVGRFREHKWQTHQWHGSQFLPRSRWHAG